MPLSGDLPHVKQTIIVEKVFLAEFFRPRSWRNPPSFDGWAAAASFAYCCPHCLRVWAFSSIPELPYDHRILAQNCARCPAPWAGSLLSAPGGVILDPWPILLGPAALVNYEFQIGNQNYER